MNGLKPRKYLTILVIASMLTACGGGGSGSGSGSGTTPSATPTPTPVPTPGGSPTPSAADFTCPSSDTTTAVAASGGNSTEAIRRLAPRSAVPPQYASGLLAVTYDRGTLNSSASAITTRETNAGARFVRQINFPDMGVATRVLSVDQAHLQSISSTMRTQQGVRSVGQVGLRYPMIVSAPYFTNDPYFQGFNSPVGPYYETASVPGQWDMHAIGLEHAFAYSQAGDAPTGFMNANALGNSSIKLAIIDTGEDTGHPELHAKVAYQKCFITNQSNNQSTSNFTTDPDGHGTDVSGIALADLNNGLGFVGAGGKVSLYAYRVFPTPDSYTSCSPGSTSTDPTCTATTIDIADAINDAVSHGVNVISMSLGGGTCSGGQDPDSLEGNAIANAIAAHIIVVAASGNAGTSGVDAPACDSSVIAAGASALGDGQPNGTNSDGSTSSPVEYVASYSQYGSPGASAHSSSAWGIVAPGGDPTGSSDGDDLHWIENIWTSVPYDPQDAGTCSGDYPNDTGTVDCRILIAGTSMATPHVAGAAALIESVTSAYSTPAAMKQLLCSTADDISDPHEGCGRLNIYRAMAKALGDPNLP